MRKVRRAFKKSIGLRKEGKKSGVLNTCVGVNGGDIGGDGGDGDGDSGSVGGYDFGSGRARCYIRVDNECGDSGDNDNTDIGDGGAGFGINLECAGEVCDVLDEYCRVDDFVRLIGTVHGRVKVEGRRPSEEEKIKMLSGPVECDGFVCVFYCLGAFSFECRRYRLVHTTKAVNYTQRFAKCRREFFGTDDAGLIVGKERAVFGFTLFEDRMCPIKVIFVPDVDNCQPKIVVRGMPAFFMGCVFRALRNWYIDVCNSPPVGSCTIVPRTLSRNMVHVSASGTRAGGPAMIEVFGEDMEEFGRRVTSEFYRSQVVGYGCSGPSNERKRYLIYFGIVDLGDSTLFPEVNGVWHYVKPDMCRLACLHLCYEVFSESGSVLLPRTSRRIVRGCYEKKDSVHAVQARSHICDGFAVLGLSDYVNVHCKKDGHRFEQLRVRVGGIGGREVMISEVFQQCYSAVTHLFPSSFERDYGIAGHRFGIGNTSFPFFFKEVSRILLGSVGRGIRLKQYERRLCMKRVSELTSIREVIAFIRVLQKQGMGLRFESAICLSEEDLAGLHDIKFSDLLSSREVHEFCRRTANELVVQEGLVIVSNGQLAEYCRGLLYPWLGSMMFVLMRGLVSDCAVFLCCCVEELVRFFFSGSDVFGANYNLLRRVIGASSVQGLHFSSGLVRRTTVSYSFSAGASTYAWFLLFFLQETVVIREARKTFLFGRLTSAFNENAGLRCVVDFLKACRCEFMRIWSGEEGEVIDARRWKFSLGKLIFTHGIVEYLYMIQERRLVEFDLVNYNEMSLMFYVWQFAGVVPAKITVEEVGRLMMSFGFPMSRLFFICEQKWGVVFSLEDLVWVIRQLGIKYFYRVQALETVKEGRLRSIGCEVGYFHSSQFFESYCSELYSEIPLHYLEDVWNGVHDILVVKFGFYVGSLSKCGWPRLLARSVNCVTACEVMSFVLLRLRRGISDKTINVQFFVSEMLKVGGDYVDMTFGDLVLRAIAVAGAWGGYTWGCGLVPRPWVNVRHIDEQCRLPGGRGIRPEVLLAQQLGLITISDYASGRRREFRGVEMGLLQPQEGLGFFHLMIDAVGNYYMSCSNREETGKTSGVVGIDKQCKELMGRSARTGQAVRRQLVELGGIMMRVGNVSDVGVYEKLLFIRAELELCRMEREYGGRMDVLFVEMLLAQLNAFREQGFVGHNHDELYLNMRGRAVRMLEGALCYRNSDVLRPNGPIGVRDIDRLELARLMIDANPAGGGTDVREWMAHLVSAEADRRIGDVVDSVAHGLEEGVDGGDVLNRGFLDGDENNVENLLEGAGRVGNMSLMDIDDVGDDAGDGGVTGGIHRLSLATDRVDGVHRERSEGSCEIEDLLREVDGGLSTIEEVEDATSVYVQSDDGEVRVGDIVNAEQMGHLYDDLVDEQMGSVVGRRVNVNAQFTIEGEVVGCPGDELVGNEGDLLFKEFVVAVPRIEDYFPGEIGVTEVGRGGAFPGRGRRNRGRPRKRCGGRGRTRKGVAGGIIGESENAALHLESRNDDNILVPFGGYGRVRRVGAHMRRGHSRGVHSRGSELSRGGQIRLTGACVEKERSLRWDAVEQSRVVRRSVVDGEECVSNEEIQLGKRFDVHVSWREEGRLRSRSKNENDTGGVSGKGYGGVVPQRDVRQERGGKSVEDVQGKRKESFLSFIDVEEVRGGGTVLVGGYVRKPMFWRVYVGDVEGCGGMKEKFAAEMHWARYAGGEVQQKLDNFCCKVIDGFGVFRSKKNSRDQKKIMFSRLRVMFCELFSMPVESVPYEDLLVRCNVLLHEFYNRCACLKKVSYIPGMPLPIVSGVNPSGVAESGAGGHGGEAGGLFHTRGMCGEETSFGVAEPSAVIIGEATDDSRDEVRRMYDDGYVGLMSFDDFVLWLPVFCKLQVTVQFCGREFIERLVGLGVGCVEYLLQEFDKLQRKFDAACRNAFEELDVYLLTCSTSGGVADRQLRVFGPAIEWIEEFFSNESVVDCVYKVLRFFRNCGVVGSFDGRIMADEFGDVENDFAPLFLKLWRCVKVPKAGNCWLNSVSLALTRSVSFDNLLRICIGFCFWRGDVRPGGGVHEMYGRCKAAEAMCVGTYGNGTLMKGVSFVIGRRLFIYLPHVKITARREDGRVIEFSDFATAFTNAAVAAGRVHISGRRSLLGGGGGGQWLGVGGGDDTVGNAAFLKLMRRSCGSRNEYWMLKRDLGMVVDGCSVEGQSVDHGHAPVMLYKLLTEHFGLLLGSSELEGIRCPFVPTTVFL